MHLALSFSRTRPYLRYRTYNPDAGTRAYVGRGRFARASNKGDPIWITSVGLGLPSGSVGVWVCHGCAFLLVSLRRILAVFGRFAGRKTSRRVSTTKAIRSIVFRNFQVILNLLTCCFCNAATSPQTGPNPVSSVSFLITHSINSRNDNSSAFQCSVLLSSRFLQQ